MKNCLSRWLSWLSAIFLMTMLGLSAVRIAYAVPSEEDISGSDNSGSSLAAPQPQSGSSLSHSRRSESTNDNSQQGPDEGGSADEGAEQQVPAAASTPAASPRTHFPYTVRPGDTPAGIAALFGVPLADLLRINHLHLDSELMIGQSLRVPNPFLARQKELSAEVDRLTVEKQAADQRAQNIDQSISGLRAQVQDLSASNKQLKHDLYILPWWRTAAFLAAGAAALMLGIMLLALIQWVIARSRFRAVAEMNESLRRLDYKYRAALAKAELRFQELYGRRRRDLQDGQERSKSAEESDIEQLNRQLKSVLERHLQRLEPSSSSVGRARWRERLAGIGAPMEARSIRR